VRSDRRVGGWRYLKLENVLDTLEFLLVSGLKIDVSNWQGLGCVEVCVGVEGRKRLGVYGGLWAVERWLYGGCRDRGATHLAVNSSKLSSW
jgi:hypothetical protein